MDQVKFFDRAHYADVLDSVFQPDGLERAPPLSYFFFFFFNLFFYWIIIALHCCASFCCTTKSMFYICMYTGVLSLLDLLPTLPRPSQCTKLGSLHYTSASHLLSFKCIYFFNSRIIALQNFLVFCQTST